MQQAFSVLTFTSFAINTVFVVYYIQYIVPDMYKPPMPGHKENISSLSLERRHSCRLGNELFCESTNKSLVITFWGERTRNMWLPSNILRVFPPNHFDHIIMLHDASNWTDHPGFQTFIWIRAVNQIRFWYIKRFLSPHIFRAYKYIWVIDDDSRFTFDPLVYECVMKQLKIPFSSPTRVSGVAYHPITLQDNTSLPNIGRWSTFIEIGPMIVGESNVWQCLWHYIPPTIGAGYSLDFIWCRMIGKLCLNEAQRDKACAFLDIFGVHHDSKAFSGVGDFGGDSDALKKYSGYSVKSENIGLLAENLQVFNACSSNVENVKS